MDTTADSGTAVHDQPSEPGPGPSRPWRSKAFGGWAALVVVYVFWGGTYLGIRVGVETIPPLLLAGVRYLIAGLILFPIALRSGSPQRRAADRPSRAAWVACGIIGLLLLLGGNGLVSVGERTVPSGFASLLVATVPLWLLVMNGALTRTWIGWLPAIGLLAGLGGVALLAGLGDHASASGASTGGIAIILFASICWAVGTILSTRLKALPERPFLTTAMQMLVGGAVITALAAATGEFGSFHLGQVSLRSWLALLYLIGPGSILALSAYSIAVRSLPTSTVATYAYVNPVVAVILGTTILSEKLTPMMLVGGALIIAAVALIVRRRGTPAH
ncbi:MAG TPA: EamA family transporter [Streptosporangiaceae bacterium]|nr:EamA family transporter [Streptosporangiaceae bacterium]